VTDLRLRAAGAPAEEIGCILKQGRCGSRRLEPHKPTLAVQPWQFYGPRSHDILVVTLDVRRTYIVTDGSVPPSFRPSQDFLSKSSLLKMLSRLTRLVPSLGSNSTVFPVTLCGRWLCYGQPSECPAHSECHGETGFAATRGGAIALPFQPPRTGSRPLSETDM
jgi:hypothetical protein